MQSTFVRLGLLVALGCLSLGADMARAQTYPESRPSDNAWRGYVPEGNWWGYNPTSGWATYQPGTPNTVFVPATPGTVVPPGVVPPNPTNIAAPRTRRLLNGVRNPVPGPNPYADGRRRPYIEYGSGRMVMLGKPWLPGAPR